MKAKILTRFMKSNLNKINILTVWQKRVLALTKKIPRGRVTTYQLLAQGLGDPKSARAVGQALNKNPFLVKIPCHRIVKSDGCLGGYQGGRKSKINLLRKEGIKIKNRKISNLKQVLYQF